MSTVTSPHKAHEYFETRLEFTVGPNELKELIKKGEVNVIDVRAEKDYKQGHIPGAISLPKSRWHLFEGLSHNRPNVVYCYSITCLLAARACREFAENDYPVMELLGGFEEWKRNNMPVEE